jgi:hypothetical protein
VISLEKQRALKRAERLAEYHRRMRAIAALPLAPDPHALTAWQEAIRRDDHTDKYEQPTRGTYAREAHE